MRALFFIITQRKRTMSLFSVLQLIIALVFIYLILSLVTSQLQEAFAGWQEFRAKRLKESIFQLLGEEKLIYQKDTFGFVWIKDSDGKPVSRSEEKNIKNITIDFQSQKKGTYEDSTKKVFSVQQKSTLSLTEELYKNPLFKSLNQSTTGVYGYWIVGLLCVGFGGLSALSKSNLWLTILMFVLGVVFLGWALYDSKNYSEEKKRNLRVSQGPSYIEPTSLFAEALLATVQENLGTDGAGQQIQLTEGDKMDDLIAKLAKLNFYSPTISLLIEIAKTVKLEGDNSKLPKYKEKLTKLFEASQERSLGVYTRNATGVAFLVGLLIAIIANADTINMVNILARNPQTVTEINQQITKTNPDFNPKPPAGKIEEMNKLAEVTATLPIGWELSSLTSDLQKVAQQLDDQCFTPEMKTAKDQELSNKIKSCLISLSDRRQEIDTIIDAIIPVSTDSSPKPIINSLDQTKKCLEDKAKTLDQCLTEFYTLLNTERKQLQKIVAIQTLSNPGGQPTLQIQKTIDKQGGWPRVLFGWLITAIALSMGAPFWFDLLGKIMNVRNAAKPLDTPKKTK
jgi:threonine/homoserine/homoserine lactone efflux protein